MLLESSLRTFDNEGIVAQTFPRNIGPISGQCLIMIFDILLNNEKVILPFHFHRGKICRWVKANSRGKYIMQDWSRLVCKCCHARGTKVSKILQVQNLLLLVVHMILSSLLSDLWTKTDFFAFQWRELWCCVSGQVRRRMIFKSWQRPNFLKSFVIKTCEFNWLWIRLTLFTCHCHQFLGMSNLRLVNFLSGWVKGDHSKDFFTISTFFHSFTPLNFSVSPSPLDLGLGIGD